MRQDFDRQGAAAKARMRRMRAKYRKRMLIIGVLFFIIGIVAGIFAYRWYDSHNPDAVVPAEALDITPQAEPEAQPEESWPEAETPVEDWNVPEDQDSSDIFPEDEDDGSGDAAGLDAFPEVEPEQQVEVEPEQPAEAEIEPDQQVEAAPEEAPAADLSSDQVEEFDPTQGEIPEEYMTIEDEDGVAEQPAEAPVGEQPAEAEQPVEAPVGETPAEAEQPVEAPVGETPAEETPAETASLGPQVIAIVPFGESFTYATQIKADGNARVEATDEPYETVSFTQTMKSYMRPSDFATKYSTQYKLQGNEAGAGFELILNDYTGEAVIVPQNVIDFSLRSESGNTVERGYQLMDAEIAGNYGVALATNTPKLLYKRYPYSNAGEEMDYLVVTTYNDGVTQQILFKLESDQPEPTPEPVYAILQRGVKSEEVTRLQARLIELGYLKGTADGSFGQMTEDAIRKAQEAYGLEVTGIADNALQQKLYEGVEPVAASDGASYETLTTSSTGELVVNLQLRLRELGYYDGRADGGYGPQTEAAVKRAQEAYGLEATGIADDALQRSLFGASAPAEAPVEEATTEEAPAEENAEG